VTEPEMQMEEPSGHVRMNRDDRCPWCNRKTDSVTHVGEEPRYPEPGNLSMCFLCAEVSIFDENLMMRKPTVEEASEIYADPEVKEARRAIHQMWEQYGMVDERTE
jgi:hypothetical protein